MVALKKLIFVILFTGAIAVWFYNISLLTANPFPFIKKISKIGPVLITKDAPVLDAWQANGRDPFYCKLFMGEFNRKILVNSMVVKRSAPASVPPILLNEYQVGGIVYDPRNPMAIILYAGRSIMVKQNDSLNSFKIQKIGKDSITILCKGQKLYLVQNKK